MPLVKQDIQSLSPIITANFLDSLTYTTPDVPVRALVGAIGAGGGGGAIVGETGTGTTNVAASGGGAGGFALWLGTIPANTDITVVVGARGSAATVTGVTSNSGAAGGTGGNTTVSWTGSPTIQGNGGVGGVGQAGPSNATASATGGAGGSASGGNIMNVTGGRGGTAVCSAAGNWGGAVTGGGAVGITGVSYRGTDITNSSTNDWRQAGAGAGVYGTRADVSGQSGTIAMNAYSPAGLVAIATTGAIAFEVKGPGTQPSGFPNSVITTPFNNIFTDLSGEGGAGNSANGFYTYAAPGGGGGGHSHDGTTNRIGGSAGACGGGGGMTGYTNDTTVTMYGGQGGPYGGGGGGAARADGQNGPTTNGGLGGLGGAFVYIVEFLV